MNILKVTFRLLLATSLVFVLYFGYRVGDVSAGCCNDAGCGGGQTCVNAPSPVCGGQFGEGMCVSDYETCSSNSDCPNGEVCQGSLCRASGGCECGTNASGGCKSCGGGGDCWAGSVDCQPGATISLGQPVETFNSNNAWGQRMCGSIGTAQRITGCARTACARDNPDECWCSNNQVTTYRCCAAGSTEQCNTVNGSTYTRLNNYDWRYTCSSDADVFISFTNSPYVERTYRNCSGTYDENTEECEGTWDTITVYQQYTTCRQRITTCTCVSTCSNTAPTNLSVVQGSSATAANVSWTVGTGGASQRLYVDQSQTEVNNGCTTANACEVSATLASGTNSYIVTGLLPSTTYYFRVTNYQNSSCNLSIVRSYTTPANNTVAGRVYLDTNNNCSTSTPWNSSTYGSLTATLRGTAYTGTVGTDGRFSILAGTAPSFQYMDLSGIPAGYICSTASGCNSCPTLSTITSPSSTNYFYLTPRREAWWQAVGASIYAAGNVRSELPLSTTNLIESGAGGAIGALMRTSGTVDTGVGAVSAEGYTATTRYRGKLMNYDYFAAHMGVTPNTANDWAADTMNKPANNPNKVFYYLNPSGSEASVSTPWTVASGESYVVFVNGDLRIASNITVADGGFLAFIINGDLRVSPAVTDIAGLLVIDSTLITESNGGTDVAANFQGSVVSWGGVNFGRDLVSGNLTQAGERFTYRADLLTNMPDSMKVFALKWEEVVPGTISR